VVWKRIGTARLLVETPHEARLIDCRLTRRAVLIYGRSNKNFVFEFEGGVYFPSLFLLAEIHVLASVSPEKNNAHTKQPSNSA
jgi:hypothetical protein